MKNSDHKSQWSKTATEINNDIADLRQVNNNLPEKYKWWKCCNKQ